MDAANLLKPMLARGELRCIGATTLEVCRVVNPLFKFTTLTSDLASRPVLLHSDVPQEYKLHIEKDEAFARRMQVCRVVSPLFKFSLR